MMNNQMAQLRQSLLSAVNPIAIVQRAAGSNPMLQRFLPLVMGKNQQQIETTFCNMCKQRGLNPQEVLQQIRQNSGTK